MRTAVTGGAGFLASHLCDKLLEKGHGVSRGVSRCLTPRLTVPDTVRIHNSLTARVF